MGTLVTDSMTIYMAYLVRYVPSYPVTAEQLCKMATAKHFLRLAQYLSELPPDHIYHSAGEIITQFKPPKSDV